MGGVRQRGGFVRCVTGATALLAAVGLSSCSSPDNSLGSTTTTTAPGVTTTSIVPTAVAGSADARACTFLGTVEPVPVMAVPAGEATIDDPLPGSVGYRRVVEIGYRQVGSGRPLLLISGEHASMDWWSPALVQELAQHYRVTMFDLPGVGYSGGPTAPMSIDWLADISAGLSGELDLDKPVVLGWGLGGQIALSLAVRHPTVPGDVVVVDSGLPLPGSSPMIARAAAVLGSRTATPAAVGDEMFPPTEAVARGEWLRALQQQVPDVVTAAAVGAERRLEARFWSKNDVTADLLEIKVPVLVVAGKEDEVFPPKDASALVAAIPGAQLSLVTGAGYAAAQQDPTEIASILQEFTG